MKMTIRKQLIIALLAVAVVPFAITGYLSYTKASKALQNEAVAKMEMARDLKRKQLRIYFAMLKNGIENLSDNRNVRALYTRLDTLRAQHHLQKDGKFSIYENNDTQAIYDAYDGYFKRVIELNNLENLMLVGANSGQLLYAVNKTANLGKNLKSGPLKGSHLARAWEAAIRTGEVSLVDMAYSEADEKPTMYMSVPVMNEGKITSVIIAQINEMMIKHILYDRSGMGKTGEAYLVGPDFRLRSDTFLDLGQHSLINSFINPSIGSVRTVAAENALADRSATQIIANYNGDIVMSAYAPFTYLGLKWAIIAEVSEGEILEPVASLRDDMLLFGLIAVVGIIIVAVLLGNFISAPIIHAVRSIIEATDQVLYASAEIADSSTALAEGASRQAGNVVQVSATIEESTSINAQNAENAKEADSLAQNTRSSALEGVKKGELLIHSMEEINTSGERISQIIKTIEEIAAQTRMLALNAAVEAARAGEHGLGFAVVADEVKSLAQRSSEASTETSAIIQASITQTRRGVDISRQTAQAFRDILEHVNKTSDLIAEISVSAKEQSEGTKQIAGAMNEIDQVTQRNALGSEQSAASAEELNAQALAMKAIVNAVALMAGEPVVDATGATVRPTPPPRKPTTEEIFPLDRDDLREF